jgi:hypothetical protein
VKQRVQDRVDLIEALPEYTVLEEAKRAVEEAKARLKIAVRDNRDLAKLDVEIAEARPPGSARNPLAHARPIHAADRQG